MSDRDFRLLQEQEARLAVEEPGEPHCPFCGKREDNWWDSRGFQNDGDEVTLTCGRCGKEYDCVMCVHTSFRTQQPKEAKREQ